VYKNWKTYIYKYYKSLFRGKLCFCHTGFFHFAFATLNFEILLLPHFPPLSGKSKIDTTTKWANQNENSPFSFGFGPHVAKPETCRAKEKCQNLEWQSKMGKN
jgi:hypothetical protein